MATMGVKRFDSVRTEYRPISRRRAEFLGMPPPIFFMAQPNPSRIFQTFQPAEYFAAQIRREHTA